MCVCACIAYSETTPFSKSKFWAVHSVITKERSAVTYWTFWLGSFNLTSPQILSDTHTCRTIFAPGGLRFGSLFCTIFWPGENCLVFCPHDAHCKWAATRNIILGLSSRKNICLHFLMGKDVWAWNHDIASLHREYWVFDSEHHNLTWSILQVSRDQKYSFWMIIQKEYLSGSLVIIIITRPMWVQTRHSVYI